MTRRHWILMWALALVWGASYLFIKVGLEDVEPVFLVWVRLALAALVLLPLAIKAGALAGLGEVKGPLLVLALVQVVVPFLLITFGEEHIASSLTGILIASAPIFTVLLGMAGFGAEKVGGWNLAGVLLGLAGVAMLFGVDLTGDSTAMLGGLMVLTAAFGYSVGAIYLKKRLGDRPPIGLAAASMTTSAVILTPAALFFLPDHVPALDSAASIVALGTLGTGVAFGLFYRLISEIGAAKSSVVAYLAPGFSLFYGASLLGEPLTVGAVGGLTLILAGSWTAAEGKPPWQWRRRRAPAAAAPATG
jgi:drug/metabolite transporter (DMT)-like permease